MAVACDTKLEEVVGLFGPLLLDLASARDFKKVVKEVGVASKPRLRGSGYLCVMALESCEKFLGAALFELAALVVDLAGDVCLLVVAGATDTS